MAAQYYLKKRLIGAFADFIPHGETVDAQTTSSTVQPDDDPITNWTDYNLGCVTNVNFEVETQDDPDLCPTESGGYIRESDMRVVADYLTCTLKAHSEPIYRLLFGLTNKLTGATGQVPFEKLTERQITGWLRFRGVGQAGSTDETLILSKMEVKMTLVDYPDWNGETAARPVVRFQVLSNTLNDLIDDAVLAA